MERDLIPQFERRLRELMYGGGDTTTKMLCALAYRQEIDRRLHDTTLSPDVIARLREMRGVYKALTQALRGLYKAVAWATAANMKYKAQR